MKGVNQLIKVSLQNENLTVDSADDYMTKPFSVGELKARVKAHLRRHFYSHENAESKGQIGNTVQYGSLQLNLLRCFFS